MHAATATTMPTSPSHAVHNHNQSNNHNHNHSHNAAEASISSVSSNSTALDTSYAAVSLFATATAGLKVIGVLSIVLGCAIAACDVYSLTCSTAISVPLSGLWSGMLFGVTNGGLALIAASIKPRISLRWAKICAIVGTATLFMHFVPVICTVVSLVYYVETVFWIFWSYGDCIRLTIINDSIRIVLIIFLLVLDLGQLVIVCKVWFYYRFYSVVALLAAARTNQPVVYVVYGASPNQSDIRPQAEELPSPPPYGLDVPR